MQEKITSEHRKAQNKALRRGSWMTPSQRPLFSAADSSRATVKMTDLRWWTSICGFLRFSQSNYPAEVRKWNFSPFFSAKPKGPFRTKNSTALESVLLCHRRSFSVSVPFSWLIFLEKQALLSPLGSVLLRPYRIWSPYRNSLSVLFLVRKGPLGRCREIWREILVKFSALRFPGFGCATENFTKISRQKRCEKTENFTQSSLCRGAALSFLWKCALFRTLQWQISQRGGHGGAQLQRRNLAPKRSPSAQTTRPKIPKNSSITKIAQKRLTKGNAISSIFLDLSRAWNPHDGFWRGWSLC